MKQILKQVWTLGTDCHVLRDIPVATVLVADTEGALEDFKDANGHKDSKTYYLEKFKLLSFAGLGEDMYFLSK